MLIEHIARGQYMINFTDGEYAILKEVATGFHKGNLCTTIRQICEGGIHIYRDILQEGFDHDSQFESSVKVLAKHLVEPEKENEPETKCGSAIQEGD